jgi:hypothetical protein
MMPGCLKAPKLMSLISTHRSGHLGTKTGQLAGDSLRADGTASLHPGLFSSQDPPPRNCSTRRRRRAGTQILQSDRLGSSTDLRPFFLFPT